jgi:putative transposase
MVVHYVDWNSVRAGIVSKPQDYQWSSASTHILGTQDPLVNPQYLEEYGEKSQYQIYLANAEAEMAIGMIRSVTRKGLPIGDAEFQQAIEAKTNRKFITKIGRPLKT